MERKPTMNRAISAIMYASLHGPPPRLALDEIGDIGISTVNSYDTGYETAVWGLDGQPYRVETYPDEQAALAGHRRWFAICADRGVKEISHIGYGDVQAPGKIVLR